MKLLTTDLFLTRQLRPALSLILVLSAISVYTQNPRLDSLKGVIDGYAPPFDSAYINLRLGFVEGNIFSGIGDSSILSYTVETQTMAKKVNYKKGVIKAIQRIGVLYQYFLNKPLEAINYYQSALDLIGDSEYLKPQKFESLNNLANIYLDHKDYNKALEINMSLLKLGMPKYGKTLHDVGNLYTNLEEYDSAIYFLTQSIDTLSKSINTQSFTHEHAELASAYVNLCYVYTLVKNADSALLYLNNSIELIDQFDISIIKARAYINASNIYILLGKMNKAEEYANLALLFGVENQNLNQQKDLQVVLYKIYTQQSRYKDALHAYENAVVLNDSISSKDRRLEVDRKVMQYEAKQKELIAQQEIENQRFKTVVAGIAGGLIILVLLVLFFFYKKEQEASGKAKEARFKEELAKTKLIALRSQLNPHFIFNALSAIGQYMTTHGSESANEYLIKFSKLIRLVLDNSEKDWVRLEEDINMLKLYIDIEALRLSNSLSYDINVDSSIDVESTLVPSLLLQPFIENSFEHGFKDQNTNYRLDLTISKENGTLVNILDDNGVGLSSDPTPNHHSIGTSIIKRRLEYVNELMSQEGKFEIIEREKGVRVILKTPYKSAFL